MAKYLFKKSGSLAALVAGLAMVVTPVVASAQEGRGGGFRGATQAGQQRDEPRAQRGVARPAEAPRQRSEAPRAQQSAPVRQQAQSGRPGRGDGNTQRSWQRRGDGTVQRGELGRASAAERNRQRPDGAAAGWQGQGRRQDRPAASLRNGQDGGFRGVANAQRDGQWRDGNRNDDRRWDRGDNRRWDRSDNRNWDRNDNRRWNNGWRNDRRYDWNSYRNSNRNVYRLGRYSAPYRNYYYRPLSSGFRLDALFFGSNYWINDPWQYRLPPAYDGYRWVRYYDDVLLVDTYSGEVVDVIRDFFW